MSYDSMSDPNRSEQSSPSDEAEQTSAPRKPFVKPELRRETDLVDGTGTSVSWN